MTLPAFSPWLHWDNRLSTGHGVGPGTYVLAQFEDGPPDQVDPLDQRVILIAETHGQSLQKRWDQFQYSAFRGKWGHAGGVTFHALYGNGPDTATPPWLYVAATTVPPGTEDVKGFVQGLKNQLLEVYQEKFGLLPCCNVKGPVEISGESTSPVAISGESTSPVVTERPLIEVPLPGPIIEPVVQFSPWCRWMDRETLSGIESAGIYALACFDEDPPPLADILDERTVYLGETCDNSLSGRLWQFNRSAFLQKNGHSGGWSFSSRCIGQGEKLYVSVFPVAGLHEPHRSAYIRHVERRLLWDFVLRWGHRPICNSK